MQPSVLRSARAMNIEAIRTFVRLHGNGDIGEPAREQSSSTNPLASVERRILFIRGQRVLLDADLAALYGVPTRVLNQAVKRNLEPVPEDFMFRLTAVEKAEVITNCDHLELATDAISEQQAAVEELNQVLTLSQTGGKA